MFSFLTPIPGGPGFDFYIIWNTGRAILEGLSPYSVSGAAYPPAASYLFAIFALLPITASYAVWILVNGIVLVKLKKWKSLGWLTFIPLLFVFMAGQVNLVLFAMIPVLSSKNNWKASIAASVLTLKPQLAVIILPWWVVRWVLSRRDAFAKFVTVSLMLHLLPLLINPTIYSEWLTTTGWGMSHKFGGAGIWILKNQVNHILLAVFAALLVLWGIARTDEKLSRTALTLANPVLGFYDTVIMMDTAPWWLLGPVSLFSLGATHYIGNHAPYAAIPIAALLWRCSKNYFNNRERSFDSKKMAGSLRLLFE